MNNMTNCNKCGLPEKMYFCAECGNNEEEHVCTLCGKEIVTIDTDYHTNCDN